MPDSTGASSSVAVAGSKSDKMGSDTSAAANQQGGIAVAAEKPEHYTFLKGFRVEQCPLFLKHKCTQHRPYTCFYWHFRNQRRRRPQRRRDGTFNYTPDVYCDKYDEQTGSCPAGDDCPYVHRNAGDTEKRYHLRYFKTAVCVHETDAKGHCVKNGPHCAFAHGVIDLRSPVYDIKELQQLQLLSINHNESGTTTSSVSTSSSSSSSSTSSYTNASTAPTATLEHQEKADMMSSNLERDRLLNDDPNWNDLYYILLKYKTEQCKRPTRLCRQGFACPQWHNQRDRRRDPLEHKYRTTPCPNVRQGDDWLEASECGLGDDCPYCHTRSEQQFHPDIYKSSRCHDMATNGFCPRGHFCAFAHADTELKLAGTADLVQIKKEYSKKDLSSSSTTTSSTYYNGLGSNNLINSNFDPNSSANKTFAGIVSESSNESESTQDDRLLQNVNYQLVNPLQQQQSGEHLLEQQQNQSVKPIGSERERPRPGSNLGEPTSLSPSPNLKSLTISKPLPTTTTTTGLITVANVELETEKLIHDLKKQTEMCQKLESICLQYKQWVDKLTVDLSEWKARFYKCEAEKKALEIQLSSNKLHSTVNNLNALTSLSAGLGGSLNGILNNNNNANN